jgi:hypothetical protein
MFASISRRISPYRRTIGTIFAAATWTLPVAFVGFHILKLTEQRDQARRELDREKHAVELQELQRKAEESYFRLWIERQDKELKQYANDLRSCVKR